ncbi:MAG: TetR/AcrR family transcriptional regulator [Anaerolineae bacterium]
MVTKSKKVEQGNATRAALLQSALHLFGLHGYADTSLDAIVQAAGITKGAFYHHFSSKEDVFLRVFEMVKQELSRATFTMHVDYPIRLTGDAQQPRQLPIKKFTEQNNEEVWQDLIDRCRKYIELHTDPQIRRIVLEDARSVLKWEDWYEVENAYGVVILRANLRRAMHRGLVKQLPLETLASMLTGALNEACMLVANAEDRTRTLNEAALIVEQFLDGIRASDACP